MGGLALFADSRAGPWTSKQTQKILSCNSQHVRPNSHKVKVASEDTFTEADHTILRAASHLLRPFSTLRATTGCFGPLLNKELSPRCLRQVLGKPLSKFLPFHLGIARMVWDKKNCPSSNGHVIVCVSFETAHLTHCYLCCIVFNWRQGRDHCNSTTSQQLQNCTS